MALKILKEKIDALEQQLLAIDTFSHICQSGLNCGKNPIDITDITHLLSYLIDPAMYQVEAVRVLIDEMSKHSEEKSVNGGSRVSD